MKDAYARVKKQHIREEWSEENSGDGYWIALKSGWKWDGDPVGNCHVIHEDTKAKAHAEGVMRCRCVDCEPRMPGLARQNPFSDDALHDRMANGDGE